MSRVPSGRTFRTAAKVLVPLGVLVFVVFRLVTASVPVLAQQTQQGLVIAEVMGTGRWTSSTAPSKWRTGGCALTGPACRPD
jgi:hypothetical protein